MVNRLWRRVAVCGVAAAALLAGPTGAVAQVSHSGRIEAFETNYWRFWALAGDEVTVIVEGDGDTDLDCWAVDRDGTVLGSDTDLTDFCVVRVTAAQSGFVSIRIENFGEVWNDYQITVQQPQPSSQPPGQPARHRSLHPLRTTHRASVDRSIEGPVCSRPRRADTV